MNRRSFQVGMNHAKSVHARPPHGRSPREYQMSDSEHQTIADIDRFRTVLTEYLTRQRSEGDVTQMQQDLFRLASQKSVRIPSSKPARKLRSHTDVPPLAEGMRLP